MRSSMLFALGGSVALVQAIAPRASPVSSATTPASSAVAITVALVDCDVRDETLLSNCVTLEKQDPHACGQTQGTGYISMFGAECCKLNPAGLKQALTASCTIVCGGTSDPLFTCGGKIGTTKRQNAVSPTGNYITRYLVTASSGTAGGVSQTGGPNFNFPITNNNNLNFGSGSAGSTGTGASGATNGNGGTGAAGAGGAGTPGCPDCDAAAAAAAAAADCDNSTTGTGTGTTGTGTGTTGTTGTTGGGAAPVAVPDGGAKAAATGGVTGAGTTPATVVGNSGQRLTTTGASLFAFFGAVMILL